MLFSHDTQFSNTACLFPRTNHVTFTSTLQMLYVLWCHTKSDHWMWYKIWTEPTFEWLEKQAGDVRAWSSGSVGPRWGGGGAGMNFNIESLDASLLESKRPHHRYAADGDTWCTAVTGGWKWVRRGREHQGVIVAGACVHLILRAQYILKGPIHPKGPYTHPKWPHTH